MAVDHIVMEMASTTRDVSTALAHDWSKFSHTWLLCDVTEHPGFSLAMTLLVHFPFNINNEVQGEFGISTVQNVG